MDADRVRRRVSHSVTRTLNKRIDGHELMPAWDQVKLIVAAAVQEVVEDELKQLQRKVDRGEIAPQTGTWPS